MMKKLLLASLSAGAFSAALMAQADPANALAIRVSLNGVFQYQVDDNEATPGESDSSAAIGHLQHNRQVGDFILGTASVLSSQAFGNVDFASLGTTVHATTIGLPGQGTDTLEILSSETGFTAPNEDTFWNLLSDFGFSTFDDSFVVETYVDFGNGLFNVSNLVHSGNNATPNVEDPVSFLIPENLTETPFSITHRILVQHTADGESLITNRTTISTPEPAAIGLFGLGVLGLAAAARRRKTT